MARYIDADKLKNKLSTGLYAMTNTGLIIDDCLDRAPTEDVAPIKHAFWKYDGFNAESLHHVYQCSHCSAPRNARTAYCPWCGAKMDFEEIITNDRFQEGEE